MNGLAAVNIFDSIANGLSVAAKALGLQYIGAIFIGIVLLGFLYIIISIRRSYETKLLKAIDAFNAYFSKKAYIGEDNLIEFNSKMKAAPRILRNRWQMYILNREDGPNKYINLDSCVEKPLRTSAVDRNITNFTLLSVFLAIGSLMFSFALMTDDLTVGSTLFKALVIPTLVILLAVLFIIILRGLKNAVHSDLFEYFHIFEQNLTRAVTTLPSYIDYEVLFTKKEIKDGIPVLQQYLEKRALIEQQELEKARQNAIEVESYNFEELGVNGSLVLERAMRECEVYLSTRRRLQLECDNIESERENYARNFEITSKDYQRKLQVSRENLESLKKQQESSTNRIESNYIKKQQADEIKKQQQIEKDADAANAKFKEEQEILKEEIEKRKSEIEERRKTVEDAMKLEFKNYAKIMFAKLNEVALNDVQEKLTNLSSENEQLKTAIKSVQTDSVEIKNIVEDIEKTEAENREREELLQGTKKEEGTPKFVFENYDLDAERNSLNQTEVKAEPEVAPVENKAEETFNFETPKTEEFVFDEIKPQVPAQNIEEPDLSSPPPPAPTNIEFDEEGNIVYKDAPKVAEVEIPKSDIDFKDTPAVIKSGVDPIELENLQKRIEEENLKLSRQKQEFDAEINSTISKFGDDEVDLGEGGIPAFDASAADDEGDDAPEQVDDIQAMLDAMAKSQPAPAPEPELEIEVEEPEVVKPAKKPEPPLAPKAKAEVKPAAKKPAPKKSKKEAVSDIDDINSEMEKLLSSLEDDDE